MVELDFIDHKLMDVLQQDGRMSVTDLSKRVNLSPTPCTLRMRKLEDAGVIQGYHARISPQKLGITSGFCNGQTAWHRRGHAPRFQRCGKTRQTNPRMSHDRRRL